MKVVIEVENGRVVGVYGSAPDIQVKVYEDLNVELLTGEEVDALDIEQSSVPFVLYTPSRHDNK